MYLRRSVTIALAISMMCLGCNANKPTAPSQQETQPRVIQGYQRFVPFRLPNPRANQISLIDDDLDFALDTKTGQLCKTWPYVVEKAKDGVDSGIETGLIPGCLALYNQYPDSQNGPVVHFRSTEGACVPGTVKTAEQLLKCYGIDK